MSDPQPRARRRARPLTVAIAVISLAGVAIATYLTILHYAGSDPVCVGGGGGCHVVQNSDYAELAGIPVSLLGLVGYVALGLSLLVPGEPGRALGMGLALAGAGFSLYLTYLELWVIDAICQWCVASAILMVLLAILMTVRLLRHGAPPGASRTRA
jgi:uncharacterized membrane protein